MPETSTQITVTKTANGEFQVDVRDTEGETHHAVRADEATIEKFGHGQPAETVVETSFRFLLEREPKVSILGNFELSIIGRFFPEYEAEMERRLGGEPTG